MYERNAIVLERYFDKIFDFSKDNNIKANYYNYRKLFENYENYCAKTEAENEAQKANDEALKEIQRIQKRQESLYNKGAKYEYSRYIIFNNIKETPELIKKYLDKVSDDTLANTQELKELGDKFSEAVRDYNAKTKVLNTCKAENAVAKAEYEAILNKTINCFESITEEQIAYAKEFVSGENKDNKKELSAIFEDNGKSERNPFDVDVIVNAIEISISIYKREIDIYVNGLDRVSKLLEEITQEAVKNDKHRKYYTDAKVKLEFLSAEKDYIVQFLDNERIGAIYDKKTHRKLMLEACRSFISDIGQINKLYSLILKEAASRFTKKAYRENYNKEYLLELEKSTTEGAIKGKAKNVAVVNLNYWRIEGLRRIYDIFDANVEEAYGRDIAEFNPISERIPGTDDYDEYEETEQENAPKIVENLSDFTEDFAEKTEQTTVVEETGLPGLEEEEPSVEEAEATEETPEPETADEIVDLGELDDLEDEDVLDEIDKLDDDKDFDGLTLDEEPKTRDKLHFVSSKKALANAIYQSLQRDDDSNERVKNAITETETKTKAEETEVVEEDDSIVELYFNDDTEDENNTEALKKKTGFFKKLVGLNGKEKKKA